MPYTARNLSCLLGLLLAIFCLSGCKDKESRDEFARPIIKKTAPTQADTPASYSKCYALWWISHSRLEGDIKQVRDTSSIDRMFTEAVDNLHRLKQFVGDERQANIEGFVQEYERLEETVKLGQPGRRTVNGLDGLKTKIKKKLSPKNVGLEDVKDRPQ